MARKDIGTIWNRQSRNNMNSNFEELYNVREMAIDKAISDIKPEIEKEIKSTTQFIWQTPVDAFEDIATTYPNPEVGYAVMARDTGKTYRYDGTEWKEVQDIDPTAINEMDSRLSSQIKEKVNQTEYNNDINGINNQLNIVSEKLTNKKFRDIQEPFYICHRGAGNIFPENTIEAYKGCIAIGNNLIEQDVRQLGDGALCVMHDSTVDRTTDGTGSVADFSTMGFKSLNVDALSDFSKYKQVPPPLFEDVLQTFGNKAIYFPESKSSAHCQKIVDALKKYHLTEHALIQSSAMGDLTPAINASIPTLLLTSSATADEMKAKGIEYVGIPYTASDGYVSSIIESGLKVIIWTINNRHLRDKYLNMGVAGFFSDDPFYLSGSSPVLNKDPFFQGVFTHGMIPSYPASTTTYRGEFIDPNKWGFMFTGTETRQFVLQGWAELPESYTIQFDVTLENDPGGGWGGCALSTPIDHFNDDTPLSSGYNLFVNSAGRVYLYEVTNGAATQIGRQDTVAIPVGGTATLKAVVTPTSITVYRPDYSSTALFSVNNSAYRGKYLHFGRKINRVTFSNVTIS